MNCKATEPEAWTYFTKTYPAIAEYLMPFAERARKRDDQGRFWWELRPYDCYHAFEGPKILYRHFAQENDSCL